MTGRPGRGRSSDRGAVLLLDNPIQPYCGGGVDGLARIVGTAPTGGPEAELWVGAHRRAPSVVLDGPHAGRALPDVLASDPERWLGPRWAASGDLPFLLKVLCIGAPLSLQAHPSQEQAEAGFAREEAAGIAIDADERTYRDRSAKPEMLVALEHTWALCGFRPVSVAASALEEVGPSVEPLVQLLRSGGGPAERLAAALSWLLGSDGAGAAVARAGAVAAEARASVDGPVGVDPWYWVNQLAQVHPGDPLCLAPLLLEVVHLEPGEALHLPAGNLHAYLRGAGVEVMASSDNVLRGGLTPKHVDVAELLAILDTTGVPDRPVCTLVGGWTRYDAGEQGFELAADHRVGEPLVLRSTGPTLVLAVRAATAMATEAEEVVVAPGRAALLEPGVEASIEAGASAWVATVGGGFGWT